MHDFNLVLVAACHPPDMVSFGLLNENDHACIASLLEKAAPFYRAVDF